MATFLSGADELVISYSHISQEPMIVTQWTINDEALIDDNATY